MNELMKFLLLTWQFYIDPPSCNEDMINCGNVTANIEDCQGWENDYLCPRWLLPTDNNLVGFLVARGITKYCTASEYPFEDKDGICNEKHCNKPLGSLGGRFKPVQKSFEAVRNYLANCQYPIIACMYFSQKMLKYKASEREIWNTDCPKSGDANHAVLIVGAIEMANQQVFIIFNNHHGFGYGQLAFLPINRRENENVDWKHRCGITDRMFAIGTANACPLQ